MKWYITKPVPSQCPQSVTHCIPFKAMVAITRFCHHQPDDARLNYAALVETARVIIEVVAGVIPEMPEPEHTKRWAVTSEEWAAATAEGPDACSNLLADRVARAHGYAFLLSMQPDRFNWVRVDWLWL